MVKYPTKEEIQEEKRKAKEERSKIDQDMIELSSKKKQFDKLVESLDNLEWYYYHKENYEQRYHKVTSEDTQNKSKKTKSEDNSNKKIVGSK